MKSAQRVVRLETSMSEIDSDQGTPELERVWTKVREELEQGLRHGFFEYTLSCEAQQGKRRLTLKAGRSYRFNIPDSELVGS